MRIVALLIAAATAGAAAAPLPVAMPMASLTAPWKIAGVGLGLKPPEVASALKAAGYALERRYMGRSWQGEVASQASNLRAVKLPAGAEVVRKEEYRKGQEFIQVDYAAGPAGPHVSRVYYQISSDAIDAERFKAAALSRYGRPVIKGDWDSVYCSVGEPQCSRIVSLVTNQLPSLSVQVIDGINRTLELRQGQRADHAYAASVKAEVERRFPKKERPSF